MASIPQYYYSDYISNQLSAFPTPAVAGGAAMCREESLPFFDNGPFDMVPAESDVTSPFSMTSLPEHFGVSDMAVPTLPEFYLGCCDDSFSRNQNFGERWQPDVSEFREECTGAVPDFRAVDPTAGDNWGNPVPVIEEPTVKVGRYSVEERKSRILRYLKKRNRRNFNKTIKYACRKTLADKRVRVRGRFARNNELSEEEEVMNRTKLPDHAERELYEDSFQIKPDGEDWFEKAMASLMYLPYIAGWYDEAS